MAPRGTGAARFLSGWVLRAPGDLAGVGLEGRVGAAWEDARGPPPLPRCLAGEHFAPDPGGGDGPRSGVARWFLGLALFSLLALSVLWPGGSWGLGAEPLPQVGQSPQESLCSAFLQANFDVHLIL